MSNADTNDVSSLKEKHCVPCEIGTQPFDLETIQGLLPMVPKWKPDNELKKIVRSFRFKDFVESMRFINKVAELAEEELSLIHISEPTRLGMISYAVFCLKKKKKQ